MCALLQERCRLLGRDVNLSSCDRYNISNSICKYLEIIYRPQNISGGFWKLWTTATMVGGRQPGWTVNFFWVVLSIFRGGLTEPKVREVLYLIQTPGESRPGSAAWQCLHRARLTLQLWGRVPAQYLEPDAGNLCCVATNQENHVTWEMQSWGISTVLAVLVTSLVWWAGLRSVPCPCISVRRKCAYLGKKGSLGYFGRVPWPEQRRSRLAGWVLLCPHSHTSLSMA